MALKHLIEPQDFTIEEMEELFRLADNIFANPTEYLDCCHGKILASLFFEPSTRTRISFEAAMLRLGGQVINITDAKISSVAKGESLRDTLRIVEGYADICCMRHPENFAPHKAAPILTTMPLINAGDGSNAHPTQTLTDLMTIRRVKGELDNLTIGLCGDLKYGRTVHSLLAFMKQMPNNSFYLIAPEEVMLGKEHLEGIDPSRVHYASELAECIDKLDVLYMTRIQRERFENLEKAYALEEDYHLDIKMLEDAKKDLAILHPLPRVQEIPTEIDDDPRALYFQQAKFGMYVRMALILYLLEARDD